MSTKTIANDTTEGTFRIIGLEVQDFKRISLVEIKPDGGLQIIAGENEQGKSTLLDSIEATLGGERHCPAEPIRRGKRRARVVVDLGDLIAERTWTATGSKLVLKDRDGKTQKAPQGILDELCNKLTFDPDAFSKMSPEERTKIVRELGGVDVSELEAEYSRLFEERKTTNKAGRDAEGALKKRAPVHEDAPDAEVSVTELLAELEKREAQKKTNDSKREALKTSTAELEDADANVRHLEEQLAAAREKQATITGVLATLKEEVEGLEDPDVADVRRQMAESDAINAKVRDNVARAAAVAEVAALEKKSKSLSDQLADNKEERAEKIAEANFPVEGLGFDELGVTVDGLPWDQASTSRQIRVSVAIGAALHPRLRTLLIRNGNDLDGSRLKLLAETAKELDFDIWVERIAGGPGAVVIEDGHIAETTDGGES